VNNNLQQLRKISLDLQKTTIKKDMHTGENNILLRKDEEG